VREAILAQVGRQRKRLYGIVSDHQITGGGRSEPAMPAVFICGRGGDRAVVCVSRGHEEEPPPKIGKKNLHRRKVARYATLGGEAVGDS